MTTAAVVIAAVLAGLAVVFVARPFLRETPAAAGGEIEVEEADARLLALAERRDRALLALKELEFDHRTGKISDPDYHELLGPLRREAAAALRELDAATAREAGDAA